ncbi:uncharacterized protein E0L32_004673 [Thyridium curvatum]|uniref:RRM domain-containing protein n=1 Tax=Thyridium curvatum TaxID=1093900 RepID=A0A507AWG2_9PEZI|nr:uncharacterized protein E0L32_004673 [Thyridium curvatum]TPX15115.1 hypothetical protein E0L32_004673 [Thyridium curvatum]
MATTAMDYEAANGDRFEGQSQSSLSPSARLHQQAAPSNTSASTHARGGPYRAAYDIDTRHTPADEAPRYERDQRSASPRRDDGHDSSRRRSASPSGNGDPYVNSHLPPIPPHSLYNTTAPSASHSHMHGSRLNRISKDDTGSKDDDGAVNPGSNLFVTGIHPRLTEAEVTRLFEKYGEVEKCQIMRDPHSKESRGFGFVKMVLSEQADAAKEGLQGEQIEGRTLSIEKARRGKPRTPTPGKYFGPPKRGRYPGTYFAAQASHFLNDADRFLPDGGGGRGGGRFDRYDDRRRGPYGGGGGGYGGRDDPYRYRGGGGGGGGGYDRRERDYDRNYDRGGYREDRGYDRGYRGEDRGYGGRGGDEYSRGGDRYAGREDRDRGYGGEGRSYGGGGGGGGSREDRRGPGYERERYDRGGDRDAARSRDPAPAGGAGYAESAPRGDREAYGGGSH